MKTSVNINWSKAHKTILFSIIFLFAFFNQSVQATDTSGTPQVVVKYIGRIGLNPVFLIEFDNVKGEEIYFNLRDQYGTQLYSEVTKEKKYSKKIQLASDELDRTNLTLSLKVKKSKQSQVFKIYKTTQVIEEVAISKL